MLILTISITLVMFLTLVKLRNHMTIANLKNYSIAASLFTVTVGVTVSCGWIFNNTLLKSIFPGYATMKFNTALCFIFIGLSLLFINRKKKSALQISKILAVIVFIFGLITLLQTFTGTDFGIDEFFYTDVLSKTQYHGRVSPHTALCFTFMGLAVLGIRSKNRNVLIACQGLLHFVTLVVFIAIVGYAFEVPEFYRLDFNYAMALHTAITLFIISTAASLYNSTLGVPGIFIGVKVGNYTARRLFFEILAVSLVLPYLRVVAYRNHFVSLEMGIAITLILFVIIMLLLIRRMALMFNGANDKKTTAEEHFRLVVESVPTALIMLDKNGDISLVNTQTEKLFGYERNELLGKKLDTVMPLKKINSGEIETATTNLHPVFLTNSDGKDYYALKKDKSDFPVEIGLNPIKTKHGLAVLYTITDISERRKNEAIIKGQLTELQFKNKELEQFNYIASHDLQEPLRTVNNYIQVIEEDYNDKLDDEVKGYLQTISSATARMSMLVRSLLDFSRLGRNKTLSTVDCNILVKNVIADLNNLIINTNGALVVNKLPVISAYETELRQIFQNLINNALKFAKKDTQPQVIIGYTQNSKFYEFYVTDNGIGINPKHYDRIFNIFQKLHNESEYEGHGIGLSYCRKIAEIHAGKIWVESELGKGSTFKFTISKRITTY